MKGIIYKKNIIAVLCLSIIFFTLNTFITAMSDFDLFHPFLYSLLQDIAILPLLLLAGIIEGIYRSLSSEYKLLKFIIVAIFVGFYFFTIHINNQVLHYATL